MVKLNLQTSIHAPMERCFDLSRSIEVHLQGTEKTEEKAIAGITSGLIGMGESVCWRARHFGVRQQLTSKITAFDRPSHFQDTMVQGAFRFMQHDHFFTVIGPNVTVLRDRFVFAAPLPILGLIAEQLVLKRYMRNFLMHRNAVLKRIAESEEWRNFLPSPSEI